jgi:hypothetical protein
MPQARVEIRAIGPPIRIAALSAHARRQPEIVLMLAFLFYV